MKNNPNQAKNGGDFLHRFLQFLAPVLFWIVIWEIASLLIGREVLLPSPLRTLSRLGELLPTAAFWQKALSSLVRIGLGTLGGILVGVLLAMLTKSFKPADLLLSPAIRVMRTIPVTSFILLVLLWVRKDITPGVIAGMMALPLIWESTLAGLAAPDPLLLEMAKTYEMSRARQWRLIRIPALMPHFLSGLSGAIGLSWKAGIAAEVLCVPAMAIGKEVYQSKLYLETVDLFAWTAVVVILSLLIEAITKKLIVKAVAKWK